MKLTPILLRNTSLWTDKEHVHLDVEALIHTYAATVGIMTTPGPTAKAKCASTTTLEMSIVGYHLRKSGRAQIDVRSVFFKWGGQEIARQINLYP